MVDWKQEAGNWEKYWKQFLDKSLGEEGQKLCAKSQEVGKIMYKLGETQFKSAKLVMELAMNESDEEFKKETEDLRKESECFEKKINALSGNLDSMLKR